MAYSLRQGSRFLCVKANGRLVNAAALHQHRSRSNVAWYKLCSPVRYEAGSALSDGKRVASDRIKMQHTGVLSGPHSVPLNEFFVLSRLDC